MADDKSTWVALHRKITDWQWYTVPNTFRLFVHLLIKANHEDTHWRGVPVLRGQVFTGRKLLAKELDLSEQEIRTALKNLLRAEIAIESTNKYSIITILNYDSYQYTEQDKQPTSNQQATNKQPTSNHIRQPKQPKQPKEESLPRSFLTSEFYGESYKFADWFREITDGTVKFDRDKWAQVWDALRRIDKRTNRDEMIAAIKWSRSDSFWSDNFKSPVKLRQRNSQGEMYIDVFLSKHKNGKQNGHAGNFSEKDRLRSESFALTDKLVEQAYAREAAERNGDGSNQGN